jgi:hypothetical protein
MKKDENMDLTASQLDSMRTLGNYVGQTINVLTSQYTANVDREFVSSAKGIHQSSALRGLEKKGYIHIEQAMWKGASVTVLKALEN